MTSLPASPVTEISLHSKENRVLTPKASLEFVQSHSNQTFDLLSKAGLQGSQLQVGWTDESLRRGFKEEEIIVLIPEGGLTRLNEKALLKKLHRVCGGFKIRFDCLAGHEETDGKETTSSPGAPTGNAAPATPEGHAKSGGKGKQKEHPENNQSETDSDDETEDQHRSNPRVASDATSKKRRRLWLPLIFQTCVHGEQDGPTDTYNISLKLLIELSSNHKRQDPPPSETPNGHGGPWSSVRVVKASIPAPDSAAPASQLAKETAVIKDVLLCISMDATEVIDTQPSKRDSKPDPMYICEDKEISTGLALNAGASPGASANIGSTKHRTTGPQPTHQWKITPDLRVSTIDDRQVLMAKTHYTVNPYCGGPPPDSADFPDAASVLFGYKTEEITRQLAVTADVTWSVHSVGNGMFGSRRKPLVATICHHASAKLFIKARNMPNATLDTGSDTPRILLNVVKLCAGESKELEPKHFDLDDNVPVVLGGSLRMQPGSKHEKVLEKLKRSATGFGRVFGNSSSNKPASNMAGPSSARA